MKSPGNLNSKGMGEETLACTSSKSCSKQWSFAKHRISREPSQKKMWVALIFVCMSRGQDLEDGFYIPFFLIVGCSIYTSMMHILRSYQLSSLFHPKMIQAKTAQAQKRGEIIDWKPSKRKNWVMTFESSVPFVCFPFSLQCHHLARFQQTLYVQENLHLISAEICFQFRI